MITKEDVLRVAKLARIQLNSQETEKFQKDLSAILDYFASLQELDVSGVKETTHSVQVQNVMREDQEATGQKTEGLLQTTEQKDGFLKVPSILP